MWRLNNHLVVWRKGSGVIMAQFQVNINSAPAIIGLPPYTERDNTDVIWQDIADVVLI
ncbi:hypothetical protein U3516DRAFT_759841 [Neocallimastix sp. 'constans']